MLAEKVAHLLNEQVTKEFFSSYLYLSFANYYEEQGLKGFAHWYEIQEQEERDHAMLFRKYLQNNDHVVTLGMINKPDKQFQGFIDPFRAGLQHEKFVTSLIHTIYDEAYQVKDFRTMQFLDWFIKEQGEEETTAADLIKKYELFAGDPKGLYMLDNELSARVYTAPSLVL